jgi:2-polyprenyl-3-methyl-5-hydroxy-6-metoxy-1,4-benzoquinol methylase
MQSSKKKFDIITCSEVIEHILDYKTAITNNLQINVKYYYCIFVYCRLYRLDFCSNQLCIWQ